jgi:hypothetical protein
MVIQVLVGFNLLISAHSRKKSSRVKAADSSTSQKLCFGRGGNWGLGVICGGSGRSLGYQQNQHLTTQKLDTVDVSQDKVGLLKICKIYSFKHARAYV